jgi:hypothetical protein
MKRTITLVSLVLALLLVAAGPVAADSLTYSAHLYGGAEVPAVTTRAQGQVIFRLSDDGTLLRYKLIVANIEDVRMAHIHLGAPGANGGVVAWLYPGGPPAVLIPGRSDGVLAEGVLSNSNLVGALAGKTISDLVGEFQAGNAYVNVHTTAHGGGEIRGQIPPARGCSLYAD